MAHASTSFLGIQRARMVLHASKQPNTSRPTTLPNFSDQTRYLAAACTIFNHAGNHIQLYLSPQPYASLSNTSNAHEESSQMNSWFRFLLFSEVFQELK
jgi:hypothetical protein